MTTRGVSADDLERFRIALEAAISRSSLRAVAEEVGMSPSGLTKFLDGASPYGKTVERLQSWYIREVGVQRIQPDHIANQLRRIVATLSEPDSGVANLLDAVVAAYAAEGMEPPQWVAQVRALLRAGQKRRSDTPQSDAVTKPLNAAFSAR